MVLLYFQTNRNDDSLKLHVSSFSHIQMTEIQSYLLLKEQLEQLKNKPIEGFSAGLIDDADIYRWEVLLIGPPATFYELGMFKTHIYFPIEYPFRPPKMKFITPIWHPNIDKNGLVHIPMLHEPGDVGWGYESANERWLPTYAVEAIRISVISMMAEPYVQTLYSNYDATEEWRENSSKFKRNVLRCVRLSQK